MTIVHCKRDSFDVYIGRPATPTNQHWGNPFTNRPGTKAAIIVDDPIQAFRLWLRGEAYFDLEPARRTWMLDHIGALHGKVLGCWCAPKPCHGDILEELLQEWVAESINGAGELDDDDLSLSVPLADALLPQLEADDDLFAHVRPASPRTSRIVCAVCEMLATVPTDAPARLCAYCATDLDASATTCTEALTGIQSACEAALNAYTAVEQALTPDIAARWERLCTARVAARNGLDGALLARCPVGGPVDALRARQAAAVVAWERVQRQVAKTLADTGNPLIVVLTAERTYHEHLQRLKGQRLRWERALGEVEAARSAALVVAGETM
jgi:hypothetical protein